VLFRSGIVKENVSTTAALIKKIDPNAGNAADVLRLAARLGDERGQLLDLSERLWKAGVEHDLDEPTMATGEASRPSSPVWPRRGLIALLAGMSALVVSSAFVLFTPRSLPPGRR